MHGREKFTPRLHAALSCDQFAQRCAENLSMAAFISSSNSSTICRTRPSRASAVQTQSGTETFVGSAAKVQPAAEQGVDGAVRDHQCEQVHRPGQHGLAKPHHLRVQPTGTFSQFRVKCCVPAAPPQLLSSDEERCGHCQLHGHRTNLTAPCAKPAIPSPLLGADVCIFARSCIYFFSADAISSHRPEKNKSTSLGFSFTQWQRRLHQKKECF